MYVCVVRNGSRLLYKCAKASRSVARQPRLCTYFATPQRRRAITIKSTPQTARSNVLSSCAQKERVITRHSHTLLRMRFAKWAQIFWWPTNMLRVYLCSIYSIYNLTGMVRGCENNGHHIPYTNTRKAIFICEQRNAIISIDFLRDGV